MESFDPDDAKDSDRRVSNRMMWMWALAVLLVVGGCCGAEFWAGKIINGIVTDILRMP